MAATPMLALEAVYNAVTPALPRLYLFQLPVTANRPALPYSLLIQSPGADQLMVQRNAGATGGTGVRQKVQWFRFLLWNIVPATGDSDSSRLSAALYPSCLTVTAARTVVQVLDSSVFEDRRRPPRLQARPIPRGSEVTADRVYSANVDVRVGVAYD